MKTSLLTVCLAALSVRILGADLGAAALPDRPGMPVVVVEGQRALIVAYDGDYPVAVVGGARRTLTEPHMVMRIGDAFAPGVVSLEEKRTEGMEPVLGNNFLLTAGKREVTSTVVTLVADRDLDECFLMLMVYEEPQADYAQPPQIALNGKELGHLEAGRTRIVGTKFPKLDTNKPVHRAVLVFSRGLQVRTSNGNGEFNLLFDTMEKVGQRQAIEQRSIGSHPLAVFRNFPLVFADDLRKRYAGKVLRARVTVAGTGRFDHVEIEGVSDVALADAFSTQLSTWLFLPRVVDGAAVSGTVVVPMRF